MDNMILLLSLSALLIARSSADGTRYITGNLTRVDWINDSCLFGINGEYSPTQVKHYRLCKILEQAYWRNQAVVIEIKQKSNEYYYSVSFAYRGASWANTKLENESFQYQMFGTVEDIYYHSLDGHCYVAIDTGFGNVRNNKHFHMTLAWDTCVRGINAFYSRDKVLMVASVNLHKTFSNAIDNLQLTNCQ